MKQRKKQKNPWIKQNITEIILHVLKYQINSDDGWAEEPICHLPFI
jgi:hypothetical protein